MDGGAFDQMVTPDPGEQKWPGDGAADSAWVVLYSEFTEMLWTDAGGFWVIPAAADDDGGIRGGHRAPCGLDLRGEADAALLGGGRVHQLAQVLSRLTAIGVCAAVPDCQCCSS
jgi:hypothetical protein